MPDTRSNPIKLSTIEKALSLVRLAPPKEDYPVERGFASDILSEVLARAPQGCVLITSQNNLNVIAVASYADIAGVIVTSGFTPGAEVLSRAAEEGIGLYATPIETFEVIGKLSRLGVKGREVQDENIHS
jgi:hypothetical protein